jgi:hypothetical protein
VSRDTEPDLDPDRKGPDDNEPQGHLRTTGPGPIVGLSLVGLVTGWLVRPVTTALERPSPTVGWLPVLVLFFVAAIMVGVAWSTHRALHDRRERLEPHRAVNRLVLAKACALAGALVAGGYLGIALSWLGTDADLAHQRLVHAALAGLAGALIVAGSLWLERACRVRTDDD